MHISEAEKQISPTKKQIEEKETLISNLVDMKMKNLTFDDIILTNKYNELNYDIEELTEESGKFESEYVDNYDTYNWLSLIDDFLDERQKQITELIP